VTRAAAALALAAALACARSVGPLPPLEDPRAACPASVSDGQLVMGTVLEITLCAPDRASGERWLAELFDQTRELERVFTSFDPTSDTSRANQAAGRGPRRVDPRLARLTAESLALSAATGGSFDPTVGPLVALWSSAGRRGRLPSEAELATARAAVGASRLSADPEASTLSLPAGAALDFGGIAKGWALDRLGERLRALGVTRALLSFGESSLLALGRPANWDGWGVALSDGAGGFAGTVQLRDQSLSVSGSVAQFSEIEGRRFGHVIDPKSGWPLERVQLAAVVASDGARAEAFSKALLILGERDGIALLESLSDAQGILIDAGGSHWETKGWREAVRYTAGWPGDE
jgi:thiamine biosynthesis lipoprotein